MGLEQNTFSKPCIVLSEFPDGADSYKIREGLRMAFKQKEPEYILPSGFIASTEAENIIQSLDQFLDMLKWYFPGSPILKKDKLFAGDVEFSAAVHCVYWYVDTGNIPEDLPVQILINKKNCYMERGVCPGIHAHMGWKIQMAFIWKPDLKIFQSYELQ